MKHVLVGVDVLVAAGVVGVRHSPKQDRKGISLPVIQLKRVLSA
jgi:hypothetical protein